MDIPDDAYIIAYYGKGTCKVCGEDKELRLGVCFDCFVKHLPISEQNHQNEDFARRTISTRFQVRKILREEYKIAHS